MPAQERDVTAIAARQAVQAADAPAAIGPYSQAIQCGSLLFVSGQIPINPANGNIVEGDTAVQTAQVMSNLVAILRQANLTFAHVVKTTVYLKDLSDFDAMNRVYATFVEAPPPARATVEVSRLPRDVRVEIDLIAVR